MALIRAMNSAISGIRSNQFRIDTIGDNLANATTVGFKSTRVDFQTLLSQTVSFGTAPSGFLGGIDPVQIGLGATVAQTSRDFRQGEFEVTGRPSDLAIEGDGFFILKDEAGGLVYSRDGSFSLNPSNLLHNPSNGFIVQGINADLATFTIASGAPIENISIPVGTLQVAQQTTSVRFDGNLNGAGTQALQGSVIETSVFVDLTSGLPAVSGTLLVDLGRAPETPGPNIDLNLASGTAISVTAKKGGRQLPTATFIISPVAVPGFDGFGTTLGEFAQFVQRALGINPGSTDLLTGAIRDDDLDPNTPGTAGTITDLVLSGGSIIGIEASGTDLTAIQVGDIWRVNTGIGAGQIAVVSSVDLMTNRIFFTAPLSTTIPGPIAGNQFTVHEPPRVSIGGFPSAPGRMRIAGNVGAANNITDLQMTTSAGVSLTPFFTRQTATGESVISNATVYDSLGNPHLVEITYVLETQGGTDPSTTATGNTFRWFAESRDNQLSVSGAGILNRVAGTGTITFSTGGAFLAQNPAAAITLTLPNSGAATPLVITPDYSSLSGFASQVSNVFMLDQDGFPVGVLTDFSVGENGIVTGIFSNGMTRPLAQIILARFQNPNGLTAIGSNLFVQGANSGIPIQGQPGTFALGSIRSGVLEASNVDLAKQFTDLIVAQRSFQADARVITTANELLEELVRIV